MNSPQFADAVFGPVPRTFRVEVRGRPRQVFIEQAARLASTHYVEQMTGEAVQGIDPYWEPKP